MSRKQLLMIASTVITVIVALGLGELSAWMYEKYFDPDHQRAQLFKERFPTDKKLYGGRMPFVFRPGGNGMYAGIPIMINSEGFRDREIEPRINGIGRISIIGDSIVFGHGLADKDTLGRQLESNLLSSTACPVEVFNFGIPGSNTYDQFFVAKRIVEIGTDVVVWIYYFNDPIFERWNLSIQKCVEDLPLGYRFRESLQQRFHLFKVLTQRWDSLMAIHRYGFPSSFFAAHEDSYPGFQCVSKNLAASAELFRKNKVRALFAVYPVPFAVGPNYPFAQLHQKMLAVAERNGFEVLDLAPAFASATAEQVMLSNLDRHPNGIANALAAKVIADYLRRQGMLKRPKHTMEPAG